MDGHVPPLHVPEEARGLVRSVLSEPEERAWLGLLNVHAQITRALDRELLEQHELSLSSFDALIRIAHAEGGAIAITALARQVNLSPSHTSRLVIDLERRGLVARRRSAADGRSTEALATSGGLQMLHDAGPTYLKTVRRHFHDRLPAGAVDQLVRAWEHLSIDDGASPPNGEGR